MAYIKKEHCLITATQCVFKSCRPFFTLIFWSRPLLSISMMMFFGLHFSEKDFTDYGLLKLFRNKIYGPIQCGVECFIGAVICPKLTTLLR